MFIAPFKLLKLDKGDIFYVHMNTDRDGAAYIMASGSVT